MLTESILPGQCTVFDDGTIQQTEYTLIYRDGQEICRLTNIRTYSISDPLDEKAPPLVRDVAAGVWTDKRKTDAGVVSIKPLVERVK